MESSQEHEPMNSDHKMVLYISIGVFAIAFLTTFFIYLKSSVPMKITKRLRRRKKK